MYVETNNRYTFSIFPDAAKPHQYLDICALSVRMATWSELWQHWEIWQEFCALYCVLSCITTYRPCDLPHLSSGKPVKYINN